MYRGSYFNNLISTVESNLHKDSNNVVFVNNHDGILLSKNQIDSILDKNNDYHVLTHEYNKNQSIPTCLHPSNDPECKNNFQMPKSKPDLELSHFLFRF